MTTFQTPDPVLHPPAIQQGEPVYDFSYAPDLSECDLSCGGRKVYWKGGNTPAIISIVRTVGPEALSLLWNEYGHLATEEGTLIGVDHKAVADAAADALKHGTGVLLGGQYVPASKFFNTPETEA